MRISASRGVLVTAVTVLGAIACQPAFAARAPATARPEVGKPPPSGPMLAWGDDQDGELGDGSTVDEYSPVAVNPPHDFRANSARVGSFTIAVTSGGRVWTWGRGLQGELGNGAFASRLRPVRVRLPKGVTVRSARAGFEFAVAVTTKGRVLTWGYGLSGDLGNGHRVNRDVPVGVKLPRGVRVTAVSAGGDSAIALTSTGRVLAWGDNDAGQLGNGRKASTDTPVWVRLPRHTKVTAVAAGVDHMLAVTSTGALLTWGDNSFGDLGIGATGVRRVAVRVHLPAGVKVVAASGGLLHSLALTTTGRVLAWGDNQAGQLGDGNVSASSLPVWVRLPKTARIVGLAAGRYHSLALTRAGKVLAWGMGQQGQLGNGSSSNQDVPHLVKVPGKVIAIGAGCEAYASLAVVSKIID
jgi:alpha-tubulin suppressor-like RCC1 family protein